MKRKMAFETTTHILCRVCRRWFRAITYSHLKYKHSIPDPQAYKDEFNLSWITSADVRRKVAEAKRILGSRERAYIRREWGRLSLREMTVRLGVNASTVRGHARDLGLPLLVETWDSRKVVTEIRRAHRAGKPLHSGAVRHDLGSLYRSGRWYFGSWQKAVAAAGLSYSKVRRRGPFEHWTNQRILRDIRALAAQNRVNYPYLEQSQSRLYAAARNHFGNWRIAVAAAMRRRSGGNASRS